MAITPPLEFQSAPPPNRGRISANMVIGLAVLYWLFQVVWFWRYCRDNINADAISYIGIARHVADGNFRASLHGYWSPLISWLIAAVSFASSDPTRASRLLMLPIFALCLVLIYWFTQKLWGSRLLSALAVLWFTAARGIAAFSVCFIGADLVLTAAVIVYFTLLLECLQRPQEGPRWIAPGVAHGVAFLAKAIAMPLLAFATVLAVLSVFGRSPKQATRTLILAAIFPALVWVGWGTALRQKYGVFTTGYQLHWNLLDPSVKQAPDKSSGLIILHDGRATYDSYMVADAMPPGSHFWRAKVWSPKLLRQIARKEIENVPQAAKELLVLLTPGGILALIVCVVQLTRQRRNYPAHFRLLWIVLLTTAVMVVAYAMLVFDGRYVIPVTPILMGLAIRFALPAGRTKDLPSDNLDYAGRWQTVAGVLLILGLAAGQVYWASPFRTIRQDFQSSVHEAANTLTNVQARSVITIGEGPYPEHGVGWEAGIYTAYFAGSPIVANLFEIPRGVNPDSIVTDIQKLSPDAVIIWGAPADSTYTTLVSRIHQAYPRDAPTTISDPRKGEVATVVILKQKS
jgi:4-amino-4-deoxy-L-arabinose transferase-like glycosyltransferase